MKKANISTESDIIPADPNLASDFLESVGGPVDVFPKNKLSVSGERSVLGNEELTASVVQSFTIGDVQSLILEEINLVRVEISSLVKDLSIVRDQVTRLEQEIVSIKKEEPCSVAGTAQILDDLEGHGVDVNLWGEKERQKAVEISRLSRINHAYHTTTTKHFWDWKKLGQWLIFFFFSILVVIGIVATLLPRQTESEVSFLIDTGSMYLASGNRKDAQRVLDTAVGKGIDDAETLGRVGEMYRQLEKYDKAIYILERAVQKEPGKEAYLLSLARSYAAAERWQEAIVQYNALIKLKPTNVWYYAEIGHQYRALKNYDAALMQYQQGHEINPNVWQMFQYMGDVYRDMQKYDKAIAQYQELLAYSSYYWAFVNLGRSYADMGDHRTAIEYYQEAAESATDDPWSYYWLGQSLLALGNYKQAIKAYQQSIGRNYELWQAYLGLGKAYAAIGNCASATVNFINVLQLNANNEDAKDGLMACGRQ